MIYNSSKMPTTNIHSDKRRKGKSHRGHQKKLKMEVRQDTNSEEVSDSSQSSEEGSGYSFMSPYSSNRSFSGCIWFPMFPTILSIDQYFNYGSYFPFYMYNYGIPYYEMKLELSDDETEDCPSYDEYIPEMAPDSLPSPSISTNSLSTTTITTETLSSTIPKASTVQPNYDLIWNDEEDQALNDCLTNTYKNTLSMYKGQATGHFGSYKYHY